ncbi:hypothetical protein FF38_06648 [Lucilia cuprina]|uniref:Chromatin-remodeling ATPase INO80 n=1 Tax=Lucilia cuprina TaxID=7375 RepID=A0A0L0BYR1_LUCCU|nr:hypothetical protein FF38_06648 [Lucilia cuprina]
MPTLFDSHEEFSDWFSKDIESHATKNKELNEAQLKRLHMILKPFMLRRVKKHVQQELGDKIEIDLYCNLTPRQKMLYKLVKSQISIKDLIERGASGDDQASLMNLVMQFRKVCNHPDLFDRQEVISAFSFAQFGNTTDWLREPPVLSIEASARNPIEFNVPKIFSSDSGLLELPSEDSTHTIRENIIKKLSVVTDPSNAYVNTVSKFSGTPAGDIVRAAQRGLFEKSLDNESYDLINDHLPSSLQIVNNSSSSADRLAGLGEIHNEYLLDHYIKELEPAYFERVTAPPISMHASERFFYQREQHARDVPFGVYPLTLNDEWNRYQKNLPLTPGRLPNVGAPGFTTISVPSMTKFIADSGKLKKLDELLVQLKKDDHRVLGYVKLSELQTVGSHVLSPAIYTRDHTVNYSLRTNAARQLLGLVDKKLGVYPFKLNYLGEDINKFKLGLNECIQNHLIVGEPIFKSVFVRKDQPKNPIIAPVAREVATVKLIPAADSTSGYPEILRLSGGKPFPPSWTHSKYSMAPGIETAAIESRINGDPSVKYIEVKPNYKPTEGGSNDMDVEL